MRFAHRLRPALWPLLAVAAALGLYVHALDFGLIWDDPRWYQQGAGQSAWQIFTALDTYQFYRPLLILLNQLLVSPLGVVNVRLAHLIQFAAQALVVALSAPVLELLGLERAHARLATLLFVLSPFVYQAVAWQAPQQPTAMAGVLLSVWLAGHFVRGGRRRFLVLSLLVYAAALLDQECALPFVLLFPWLAARQGGRRAWPLLHLGLAGLYALVWLSVPRQAGVTGQGFQPLVLGYLLQGVAFPVAGPLAAWLKNWPLPALTALFGAIWLGLAALAWRGRGRAAALLLSAWILAGLLPIWVGLSWDYVSVGSRLLYPAALGISGLWAGVGVWVTETPRARRVTGAALLALVIFVSLSNWVSFRTLYARGTRHLRGAVEILSSDVGHRYLFVNFPDRLELRPAPYPLGFWGLTLAPVVQHLSDYARAERGGGAARDESYSVFVVGAAEREQWPYRVDMRGENTPPERLFAAARGAQAVLLTDYLSGGGLRLWPVGQVREAAPGGPVLARLGEQVELAAAQVAFTDGRIRLRLDWRCLGPLRADDTLFVHLWQAGAFVEAYDGDSLGGLIPPAAWAPGTEITDQRMIGVAGLAPGEYEVRVGIYNRAAQSRYPARDAQGTLLPEDEIPIGRVRVP